MHRFNANTIAQHNNTNPQVAQWYRTRTDASNGEWAEVNFPATSSGVWSQFRATGNGTGSANISVAITPRGAGSISSQPPDNTATFGGARGDRSVDWQTLRNNSSQVASGQESVIGGGSRNTASALNSTVGGGTLNWASAQSATIAGGGSNTASGVNSFVGGGLQNLASGENSVVVGGRGASTRGLLGAHAYASWVGWYQHFGMTVSVRTTDASATVLRAREDAAPSTTNVLVLQNNSTWSGPVWVMAEDSSGNAAHWLFHVLAKRGANPGTTTVVNAALLNWFVEPGLTGVAVSIVANTTRGSVEVQVAGLAGTTIDWFGEFFGGEITR